MIFSTKNNPVIKIFNQSPLSFLFNTISHLKKYIKRLNNIASSFYLILAKSCDQYVNIDARFLQISNKNTLLYYPFLNAKWHKIIVILFSLIFLNSCNQSQNSEIITLEDIEKVNPIDKGVRYPEEWDGQHTTVEDNMINMRWGRKRDAWRHACASEVIKYSLSGDLVSAMSIESRIALEVASILYPTLREKLTEIIGMSDSFSDYYWDLFNPSCSAVALAKKVAKVSAKKLTADLICDGKPKPKSAQKLTRFQKFKKGIKSAASNALGLQNIKDLLDLWVKCYHKAVDANAAHLANVGCMGCSTGVAAKASLKAGMCCGAVAAYTGLLAAALAEVRIKYAAARDHQRKVVVCGHDWYGWKLRELYVDGKKVKKEVRGPYHSNLGAITINNKDEDDRYDHTYYSYKGALLQMNANNNITRSIDDQQYRELIFDGREIADPDSESDGGCMMPKIPNSKLVELYGFGRFNTDNLDLTDKAFDLVASIFYGIERKRTDVKQRYYFKGSNTEPNFACDRFRLTDDKIKELGGGYADEFLEAYNCCINRSKSMICLEYLNHYPNTTYTNLVQPYISHHIDVNVDVNGKSVEQHVIEIADDEDDHESAKEANDPERGRINFCKIEDNRCSLGDGIDADGDSAIIVEYRAYQHPLRDKYVCAESYSICPYNFTVGTGTAIWGTDIDYQRDKGSNVLGWVNNKLGSDLELSMSNREASSDGVNDCQYMNHCSIIPGDKEDLEYSFRYDGGDGYFISSACTDGRGDSQNYNFKNNFLTKTLDLKSITAPLSQCIVETFKNLLLNQYGSDYEGEDGSYFEGEVRNLPSFFDELQGSLQDILKILLICAVTLMGYKILLAGGIEKKEVMAFILKLAFVMYFVSGNAWKNIFNEAIIDLATTVSTVFVNIDGDDINIYPDAAQLQSLQEAFDDPNDFQDSDNNIECIDMKEEELRNFFNAGDPNFMDQNTVYQLSFIKHNKGKCDSSEPDDTYRLFKFKNNPENGYYFKKKDNIIYNISSNNICQFPKYDAISGNNSNFSHYASYPKGKEYLKIFDTLDCMISYALGISVLSTGGSFISSIVMSFFNGVIGFSFAIASLFFAISIFSVAIKVLISFAICIVYIVILIYISPITITCILFPRTKDVFDQWFGALVSYSLQSIFTFIFVGFFISIFNALIVKDDIRFEYRITEKNKITEENEIMEKEKRIPFLNCNDWEFRGEAKKPNMTSIYCFFNKMYTPDDEESHSVLSGLRTFGMYFYRSGEVILGVAEGAFTQGQGNSKFVNMLQIAVIAFILNYLMNLMPAMLNVLISGMAFAGEATGGNRFSVGGLSGKAKDYAQVGKGVIGGLGRRHGKQLADRINKKSQDPRPGNKDAAS